MKFQRALNSTTITFDLGGGRIRIVPQFFHDFPIIPMRIGGNKTLCNFAKQTFITPRSFIRANYANDISARRIYFTVLNAYWPATNQRG